MSKQQLYLKGYYNCLAFLLIFLGAATMLPAQKLQYHEQRGDESSYYHYEFRKVDQGYHINIARLMNNDTTDKQLLTTSEDFETLSWRYIRFGEETDVTARKTPEGVSIKGVLDGDELEEEEALDEDEPWIQLFPMNPGFEKFIFSDKDEIVFWAIGTESPADMEINSFSAEKEETEYSDEFGCKVLRVNFSPTGWRSIFWEGDFYFRPEDARIVGYRGDGAPGKPSAKTTLIKEEK